MKETHWQRKARALVRLAKDQRGKPEGDVARAKLLEIINRHPEARDFDPVKVLIEKDLTLRDIAMMHREGISTDGKWTGANLQEAIAIMQADYKARIKKHQTPKLTN